ncbi:MAG: hypothetical protein MK088_18650 [Alteromonas sp.]|nr:hypothetical protein [Alteromonas sp.]
MSEPRILIDVTVRVEGINRKESFGYSRQPVTWAELGQDLAANIDKASWCIKEGKEYDGIVIAPGDERK